MRKLTILLLALLSAACSSPSTRLDSNPWLKTLEGKSPAPTYSWKISTSSEKAQARFNQGMLFFYGFNSEEAAHFFELAVDADSNCAICHWGIALSLNSNIGKQGDDTDLRARKEARKAMKMVRTQADGISDAEKELIGALQFLYPDDDQLKMDARNRAYADAMRKVYRQSPESVDVAALFANALMNLSAPGCHAAVKYPLWDTPEINTVLEQALRRSPYHPGANHYAIHSAEVSLFPERALDSASRLPLTAPGIAHFVHMPSHLLIRLGRYSEAVAVNQAAIAADERYLKEFPDQGQYYEGFYLHNYYFLWFASSLQGQEKLATETADQILRRMRWDRKQSYPFLIEIYANARMFTRILFKRWDQILQAPAVKTDRAYVRVIENFARALAYLRQGDVGAAKKEQALLLEKKKQLMAENDIKEGDAESSPVPDLFQIATRLLDAEFAAEAKDWKTARTLFHQAIELEDGLRYSEPPTWPLSSRQFFTEALMKGGFLKEAKRVAKDNLRLQPNYAFAQKSLEELE